MRLDLQVVDDARMIHDDIGAEDDNILCIDLERMENDRLLDPKI